MSSETPSLSEHIVILGYNARVESLVRDIRRIESEIAASIRPVLILIPDRDANSTANNLPSIDATYYLFGNDTDPAFYLRARIRDAHLLIVPDLDPAMTLDDSARLLPILTARSVHPLLRVCWEVSSGQIASSLLDAGTSAALGQGLEIISSPHLVQRIIAGSIDAPSLTRVVNAFLQATGPGCLQQITLSQSWQKRSFAELTDGARKNRILLVGVQKSGEILLNPGPEDTSVEAGDTLWCIAERGKAVEESIGTKNA